MSEKDAIIRQRLIELEKKHARALRKLQRAETNRQRRQTFHGFSVQDENVGSRATQETSSILLSQEELNSPNVKKPSCFSAHKKGHCKTVTFKETVDTDHQLLAEKYQNESVAAYTCSSDSSGRRSASLGSCTQQDKPKCYVNTLQSDLESDNKKLNALNRNAAMPANDSNVLSDDNVVIAEKQDNHYNQTQEFKDQAIKVCEVEEVSKLATHSQNIKDLCHEDYFGNSEIKCTAKKMQDQNSPNITQESLDLLKGTVSLNETDGYQDKETDDSHVSTISQKLKNSSSENWHWLQLFEEEYPRRSPRLRSTPNFGSQAVISLDRNITQPKKSKTKKSRRKKDNTESSGVEIIIKSNIVDTALYDVLSEERTGKGLVFPRPSSEHTKPGGPLSVVVDFALPDKEFVKLKLAKIKSTLSAERANKKVDDKADGMTKKAVNEIHVEEESKLPDSKLTNKQQRDSVEETMEQHPETEGDFKLPYSKSGQETKGDCSVLLTQSSSSFHACSVDSNTEFQLKEVETFSSPNTIEENRTEKVTDLSSAVTLECGKQSECGKTGSFSFGHKQLELQSHNIATQNEDTASASPKQELQEGKDIQTCTLCLMESSHCNCSKSEIVNVTSLVHDSPRADGFEKKNRLSPDNERDQPCSECNRPVNQAGTVMNDKVEDKIVQLKNSTVGTYDKTELPNHKESNDAVSKTSVMNKSGSPAVLFDSAAEAVLSNPDIGNNQGELFDLAEGKSSPPNTEPRLGDQATPYGKMNEPLESSQVPCMMAPEDHSEFSPVLMTACLQHRMDGEDNKVLSLSLSSYEASSEKDASSLLQKKRDVLVVCLAHLVVIWTIVPGLQWTVLHKWGLPLDGEEEFVAVQFVPVKSHVVLLAGGNFCKGNGSYNNLYGECFKENDDTPACITPTGFFQELKRILGYSEEGDYSLDLLGDNEKNKHLFSTMCLLQDTLEHKVDKDVEFIIGCRNSHKITLTKWSLDSHCLLVKESQAFPPICSDSQLSSLQPAVCGSHCLVLGTTDDSLFLWNHKTCQQLRSFGLHTLGLGGLSCLKAVTQRGLLFLIMASNSAQKRNCVNTNDDACSLYALNPKTSKLVCLEWFGLSERVNIVGTNGQYIVAASQGRGEVNMWNINNSQRHTTLQVFQDEVSSIGFHQDRPLIAFGSASGCVHLFSLC